MRPLKYYLFFLFTLYPPFAFSASTDCNTLWNDKNQMVQCLLVDVMDSYVSDIACGQKIQSSNDAADALCLGTQSPADAFYDEGQFGTELNQRNQEAVYTLAYLYQAPYSDYQGNGNLLNRVLWGLDYLRRSQGPGGGISENGWNGIDYTGSMPEGDSMSVAGFTYYAAAQAINILINQGVSLENYTAIDADGIANDLRSQVYADLVLLGATFLSTTDNGAGNAPNQAVLSLLALYALNQACTDLPACGDSFATEIATAVTAVFTGPVPYERANYFDRWFSTQGMILEKGYKPTSGTNATNESLGYDSSYGIVTLRGLVLLNRLDSSTFPIDSGYIQDYVEGMRLYFYLDPQMEQGGFHVSALSRRKANQSKHEMPFLAAGIGQDNATLQALFNASLDHFIVNPQGFLDIENIYRGKLYAIGELLQHWQEPTTTSYTLPLNDSSVIARTGQTIYNDSEANEVLDNTDGTLEGMRYRADNWWDRTKYYYWGAKRAKITSGDPSEMNCYDSAGSSAVHLNVKETLEARGLICADSYASDGRYLSGNSDTGSLECYDEDGHLKETFLCKFSDGSGYIVSVPWWPCIYGEDSTNPSGCTPENGDLDGDGTGNYFDADMDGDGMTDSWEGTYGLDPSSSGDANIDSDGDGITNYNEYLGGTDPLVSDDDDLDGVRDTLDNCPSSVNADQANTDGDSEGDACDDDDDNDGYTEVSSPADCDDTDPNRSPGIAEVCDDNFDQDCTYSDLSCLDVDNDGDGYTENQGDCDDTETGGSFNPGTTDVCDEIDNNCDDLIDPDCDDDGDGLINSDEWSRGTDPNDRDTDNDSLSDYMEIQMGTDPTVYTDIVTPILNLLLDGDDDGDTYDSIDDGGEDCDDDNATIYPGATEICGNNDDENCDGITVSCDTDGDGVSDDIDLCPTSSPLDANDIVDANGCILSEKDSDSDGLNDYEEIQTYETNPDDADSDDDSLSDGDEVNTYNTDPNDTDTDNDSLSDYMEIQMGTDPLAYTDIVTPILNLLLDGDDDGDTYDSIDDGGEDCNDEDATIYPGATEICDDVDNNCDGNVDPDCDNDGDGLSNSQEIDNGSNPDDASSTACVPPSSEGDWTVTRDCTFMQAKTWNGNLYVQSGALITIPADISLDMDFSLKKLEVSTGSGVLIQQGGTLH